MPNTVLGKVACVPRGDYSASATYEVLDIVGYQGGAYMALKAVTGIAPSNDGVNWMCLVEKGDTGATGNTGAPGAAAGFGTPTATVDGSTGTPAVEVEASGPDTAKVFNFAFSGLKGETGAKGETGKKGDTGATGPQGVSVTDAEIDESGHLIITLSAGEPIDAGNAVGPTGAKGDTGATGPEGASVSRIERTSGTGAPGTTDTYTVYLTDGSTGGTFNVYNGSNGTGSGDFMADGSVPMTGALQMGGNRITNVGAPTADTDAVRQSDLKAVSDEVDKILDGTTPVAIPAATTAKIGGVIVGDGLSVETNGTISADSQLPEGGTNGQILTKTANGETWADPPDTGVTTFNNRSGAVVPQTGDYTAEMVGARGSDWTPTADEVGAVPTDRTVNGHALSENITLDAEDVGARPSTWTPTADDVGAVPTTRTVNGKALSDNISLTAGDVEAIANPSGGSDGQMLYKTASGAEWGNKPVMYVNITGDNDSGHTADKTFAEIQQAVNDGWAVFAHVNTSGTDIYMPLYMFASDALIQFSCYVEGATYVVVIQNTGSDTETLFVVSQLTASKVSFSPKIPLTSNNVQDAIDEVQGHIDAAKPALRTATLTTSGWSSNTQTVTVSGVVADTNAQLIYVSPADKASATAWGEAGVFCSAQGANSLTFVCDSVPSANISVNISIQEAQT